MLGFSFEILQPCSNIWEFKKVLVHVSFGTIKTKLDIE